jgi:formiminotetrahydrofolate cyclodeaminase
MILNKDTSMSNDSTKIVDFIKDLHSNRNSVKMGDIHWKMIMQACDLIKGLEKERDQARRMVISKDAQEAYSVPFPSIAQQMQFCMEEYPEWEYLYENPSSQR